MPELPEVEYAAGRLRAAALGHTIAAAAALHPSQRRHFTPADARALVGRRLERVDRRAKVQLLHFDDGTVLEVHFRMNGDWEFTSPAAAAPTYERVRFETAEGVRVSLVDSRALCVVRRHPTGRFPGIAAGPEPLGDDFTVAALRTALAGRRAAIKPVLLDQRVVAGIGNIYASEALWEAGIHPDTPAQRLAAPRSATGRLTRLHDALRLVLRTAPQGRYWEWRHPDGTPVREQEIWRVYGRAGDPCRRCGRAIRAMTQAGRTTYWCTRCQR